MRMKIPKDFTGAAICWWVFHYQEHYPNNDNRYLEFYTGGLNKENRPVVSSLLGGPDVGGNYSYEESYLPYNYLHDYGTDSGKPYLKINNGKVKELLSFNMSYILSCLTIFTTEFFPRLFFNLSFMYVLEKIF